MTPGGVLYKAGKRYCEICGSPSMLSVAHRHKRIFYKNKEDKLSDINQILLLCIKCHEKIEYSREETEKWFERLRGKDNL